MIEQISQRISEDRRWQASTQKGVAKARFTTAAPSSVARITGQIRVLKMRSNVDGTPVAPRVRCDSRLACIGARGVGGLRLCTLRIKNVRPDDTPRPCLLGRLQERRKNVHLCFSE